MDRQRKSQSVCDRIEGKKLRFSLLYALHERHFGCVCSIFPDLKSKRCNKFYRQYIVFVYYRTIAYFRKIEKIKCSLSVSVVWFLPHLIHSNGSYDCHTRTCLTTYIFMCLCLLLHWIYFGFVCLAKPFLCICFLYFDSVNVIHGFFASSYHFAFHVKYTYLLSTFSARYFQINKFSDMCIFFFLFSLQVNNVENA